MKRSVAKFSQVTAEGANGRTGGNLWPDGPFDGPGRKSLWLFQ